MKGFIDGLEGIEAALEVNKDYFYDLAIEALEETK